MQQPDLTKLMGRAPSPRQAFWLGVVFWVLVSALGIALRGIRWEETYERAQILTGMVPYPDGHPFNQYTHAAVGFHYYLSAALMKVWPDPAFICGYRSVWSAAFALLPVYAIGYTLTRRVWAAHVGALLTMAGIHLAFCSYYALQVWPDKFTAGTIGQGYALFILAAFMAQRWRTAFVLLGLMPVAHLGHMPLVLGVGGVVGFWLLATRHPAWKGAAMGTGAALAFSFLFIAVHQQFSLPAPTSGPFYAEADPLDAWRRYVFHEDIHRAPTDTPRFGPFANSIMPVVGLIAMSSACWLLDRRERRDTGPSPFAWLWWLGVGTALAVGAAKGGQAYWGQHTPFLLIGWLPYRSPNLCAFLLIPVLVYAVTHVQRGPRRVFLALIVPAWLGLRPLIALVLPLPLFERYVAPPEHGLFLLFGLAVAALWGPLRAAAPRWAWGWTAGLIGAWMLLALEHQFGALLVVLGVAVGTAVTKTNLSLARPLCVAAGCAAVALFAGLLVALRQDYSDGLAVTAFETEVAEILARESQPEELLLTPHWHLNWQEKLDHAVFMTFETPQFLTYYRRIAATSEKMMIDAYDIRFGEPWDYSLDAWKDRGPEAWRALGESYGIRFVLAPREISLPLTPVIEGGTLTLWRIGGEAGSP